MNIETWDEPVSADATGAYSMVVIPYNNYSFIVYPPGGSGFLQTTVTGINISTNILQNWIMALPDTQAPVILSGPTVTNITNSTALVQWQTSKPAQGGVKYGTTNPPGTTLNETGYLTTHSQIITGLSADTLYYLKVFATDAAGNGPVSSAVISFRTIAVTDTTPPVILEGPIITSITHTSATVTWTTSEASTGALSYGTTTALGQTIPVNTLSTSHSITLTGLTPETLYYLQVSASDAALNGPTTSTVLNFRTLAAPDTTPPVIVAGPMAINISATGATIAWTTDEPATSGVSLNNGTNYKVYSDEFLTTYHSVQISGLLPSTTYTYVVSSKDAFGNGPTLSSPRTFTTLAAADTYPPVITEGPLLVNLTHRVAIIRWKTDEPADTLIEFGATPAFGLSEARTAFVTNHQIPLTGLLPGTLYYYRVLSKDAAGNQMVSSTYTFTTEAQPNPKAPTITSEPQIIYSNDALATVSFETDLPCDTVVEYGQESTLTNRQSNGEKVNLHQITLTNLEANTAYGVMVSCTDLAGNTLIAQAGKPVFSLAKNLAGPVSDTPFNTPTLTGFTTQSLPDTTPPVISVAPVATPISSTQVRISWTTNEIADSQVNYHVSGQTPVLSAGEIAQGFNHSVVLTNLSPSANYQFTVTSYDPAGNQVTSGVFSFTSNVTDQTAPTVTAFTIPTTSSNLNLPITTFSAADNEAVTGYLVTESALPPLASDAGWTGTAPSTYTVSSTGTYTLYPWAKDAAGNVSTVFANPPTVIVTSTGFTTCAAISQVPQAECEALVALYYSAGGANWVFKTDWLQTETPCSWSGVTCTGANITRLNLTTNGLHGSLPSEIGNLTALQFLDLSYNQLSGHIPVEIGNLTALQFLNLNFNQLSGSLPAEIGTLTSLASLYLSFNSFSGEFPATLTNLVNLTNFTFNCQLTSSNPSVIAFVEALSPGWQDRVCVLPANDEPTNPTWITSSSYTTTENLKNATRNPSDPLCDGLPAYNSVWFAYTASEDGILTLNTSGSNPNYYMTLTVLTGSPGDFQQVACRNYNPELGVRVTKGQTYYIQASNSRLLTNQFLRLNAYFETLVPDTWVYLGGLRYSRDYHTATLLTDGSVLFAGGSTWLGADRAERYYPSSGAWAPISIMTKSREAHTATLLMDGRVLVAGGWNSLDKFFPNAELYDPVTNQWSQTGGLAISRYLHTATLLPDGRVLVVGGANSTGYLASAEIYNPATRRWTATGDLHTARYKHTATLLQDGRVLVVGGQDGSGAIAAAELYDPATGEWSVADALGTGRYSHTATLLPDGKVLAVGGADTNGVTLPSAELYDPLTGLWTNTGAMSTPRRTHTATLLPNGRILVAGGRPNTDLALNSSELYDPASGNWTLVSDWLGNSRYLHTATLLPDGSVLVAGGYAASYWVNSLELYNPQTEFAISGSLGANGAGATITYTGGSTTANGSGNYSFIVDSGWMGTITPTKADYTFSPAFITISAPVTTNLTGQNFTATSRAFIKYNPVNGAAGVSTSPLLNWQTSQGAASYEYCLDTSNDTLCDTGWVSRGTSKSVGLSGLSGGATYYWQARAINPDGTVEANGGAWWNFTTMGCYTLTKSASPSGSVTASPAPNCTGGKYLSGTVVQLTANPAAGYTFSTWSGGLTGSANPVSLTMDADKSVTANFNAPPGSFPKYAPGNGATSVTISPALSWQTSAGASSYEYCIDTSNDTVCDTGWISRGTSKSVGLSGLAGGTTYYWQARAVNDDGTVEANGGTWWSFTTLACYTLTTNGSPSGSVYASPATNCPGGKYTAGTVVQLSPRPAYGYTFSAWSGDLTGSANPGSVTMDADKNVTANYTTPPTPFIKYNQANGATSVSINPLLNWQTSINAASYEYCIDTSNDTVCDTGWVNRGAFKSVGLSGLAANTTYYWQVRAVNAAGTVYANGGTWWSFTTAP